jgi:Putative exonuclease, RdgC.
MSFLKSSTSFTRFRIKDSVPATLWGEVVERLQKNAITDIDELPEERSVGWVAFENMLDTTFSEAPVEKGVYLAFALRMDTRRVPPAVIKKYLAIALQKEEAANREMGKKFVSRERKKELKEQVMLRLRMRFLPIPAEFQVIWNTSTGIVFFASTQSKMVETFQERFSRTFELDLEPLTPYELAASRLGDTAALDILEPTTFA